MRKVRLLMPAAALLAAAAPAGPIAYPEGFTDWRHIGSAILEPGRPGTPRFEGMHHIYANPTAVRGYRSGRFPDGSIIVYDLWAVGPDAHGQLAPTARKHVDVMVKDSRRFAATGGWGYAEFTGADRQRVASVEVDPMRSCHGCHASQTASDSVFSKLRN